MIRFIIVWSLLPLPVALVLALLWSQLHLLVADRRMRRKPDYARIAQIEREVGILNSPHAVESSPPSGRESRVDR